MRTSSRSGAAPDVSVSDYALYGQDTWQLAGGFQLFGGARLEVNRIPEDAIGISTDWVNTTGYLNNVVPRQRKGRIGPRAGFRWDPAGKGETLVRAAVGLSHEDYDLAAVAEAAQFDGNVTVRRAAGAISWPGTSGSSGAGVVGQSLTFF